MAAAPNPGDNWDIGLPFGLKSWSSSEVLPFQKDMIHSINERLFHAAKVKKNKSDLELSSMMPQRKRKDGRKIAMKDKVKSEMKQYLAGKAAAATSPRRVAPGTSFSGLKKQLRKSIPIETYLARKGCQFETGPSIISCNCILPPKCASLDPSRPKSFKIDKSSNMWLCLDCEQRGDIFLLMKLLDKLDFWECVETVVYMKGAAGMEEAQTVISRSTFLAGQDDSQSHERVDEIEEDVDALRRGRFLFTPLDNVDLGSDEEDAAEEEDGSTIVIKSLLATYKRPVVDGRMNLSFLRLCLSDAEKLCSYLSSPKITCRIQTLSLAHNTLRDAGCVALSKALQSNKSVTSLDLTDNDISADGCFSLSKFLSMRDRQPHLVHLSLAKNPLDGHSSDDGGSGFAIQQLARAAEKSKLEFFDVSCCNIGPKGGTALGHTLQSNHSIITANFQWNLFNEGVAQIFGLALRRNERCQDLNLSWNGLTDAGGSLIAEALPFNTGLRRLDLSCNHIGENGAKQLALHLPANTTLTHLILDSNPIGSDGGTALMAILEKSATLKNISLAASSFCRWVAKAPTPTPPTTAASTLPPPSERGLASAESKQRSVSVAASVQESVASADTTTNYQPPNPALCVQMSEIDLSVWLKYFDMALSSQHQRLLLIHTLSHISYISSRQLVRILHAAEAQSERIEFATTMFPRVLDPENFEPVVLKYLAAFQLDGTLATMLGPELQLIRSLGVSSKPLSDVGSDSDGDETDDSSSSSEN